MAGLVEARRSTQTSTQDLGLTMAYAERRERKKGVRYRGLALDGATPSVNRELEAKARSLAGLKGYITNLQACPDGTPVTAEFVIGACHRLFEIEKTFRMAKSDPSTTTCATRSRRT